MLGGVRGLFSVRGVPALARVGVVLAAARAAGNPNCSLQAESVRVTSTMDAVGALVGRHQGRIAASWAGGTVTGNTDVGGLAGSVAFGSTIVATYSTAFVTVTGARGRGGMPDASLGCKVV